ncbi:MAG TPA: ABC transporter permease [Bryobacteraceae bacterium]|nr:ABC transporter permease [Bryobacteraceae bacterium]
MLGYVRSLAARFIYRSRTEDDMEEELRAHILHRADDLERGGLNRAEAERRARIEFGGRERYKEEGREALGGHFVETLIKDARFSLRGIRKSPGFATVAILTLAVAIGANALVFGVMNGLILRPLNVPQAGTLYSIEHGKEHSMYESYPEYLDLRDRNRSFEALAALTITPVGLDTGENPTSAWMELVTGNYFDVLHIEPQLGRVFHPSDEHGPNSAPYVVLSHAFWHTRFHDDATVVGRVVRLNKHPYTIVGVAPAGFYGTFLIFAPDFFVPVVNQPQLQSTNALIARSNHSLYMTFGHLKTGISPEQAIADLNSVGAYLEKTYPLEHVAATFALSRPGLYGNVFGRPIRAFVSGLMLLAGLILLAACANLSGLFAARAADRSREVALRLALGASRSRILRQFFTEAALISIAGGALGLWGSIVLLQWLSRWHPIPRYAITVPVSPDVNVYVIALVLALVSGLLFGIVPVRQVLRADPLPTIKGTASGAIGRKITVRELLLVTQIAICAVLVTASMVAIRGLDRSLSSNFGFEPRNAILASTDLDMSGYSGEQAAVMQKRMVDIVTAIPGVESVGLTGRPPLDGSGFGALIFKDRAVDLTPSKAVATAKGYNVSEDYFRAAGTALHAGRVFSQHDDKNSPRVAVVNQEFARKIFGGTSNAIGGYFKMRDGARVQVVGIVEDGKYVSILEDTMPALFLPIVQAPVHETWLIVRSKGDTERLAAGIRAALRGLDSGLPVNIETWNKHLDFPLFPARAATVALGVLGMMGVVLAITGIFGTAAYSVSKRLKELGIRMAIGARRRQILQAALGRAFKMLAIGSGAGLVLGVLSARVLAAIVYQATPRDPVVLAEVVVAMLAIGLLATWIPAQRALGLDPLTLLREE